MSIFLLTDDFSPALTQLSDPSRRPGWAQGDKSHLGVSPRSGIWTAFSSYAQAAMLATLQKLMFIPALDLPLPSPLPPGNSISGVELKQNFGALSGL